MLGDKEQLIKLLHEAKVILRRGPEHPKGFVLASGKKSDIYINIRDLIKHQPAWSYSIFCLFNLLADSKVKRKNSCILGVPTMGAVMSPIIAYQNTLPLVVLRQNKKDHGVGSDIEGNLNSHVMIIDDVITTGSSIKKIEEEYLKPRISKYDLDIFVIVDREQHHYENVYSLMTLGDIKKYKPQKENRK
jgi:orotate phosphoribosyltransferase